MDSEELKSHLTRALQKHHEWLLVDSSGKSFALRISEIEVETIRGKLFFGFLDERGFQIWRVAEFETKDEKILLQLARNFGRELAKMTLVPRISARELSASAQSARLEKVREIASLFAVESGSKILRAELNEENGRFAQILLEDGKGRRAAALADVTGLLTPETVLSMAVFRLAKLQSARKNQIAEITVLAEKKQARALRKLHALLSDGWKRRIFLKEISRSGAKAEKSPPSATLKNLKPMRIAELWRGKARKIRPPETFEPSESARRIIEFAPAEIDAVFSHQGETLRFHGLPFARIRRVSGGEQVWFGIDAKKRFLTENNFEDFLRLIDELKEYRRADSENKRHEFYTRAPESWLESVLRRDIRRLDANLILSPVYHQFRAEREKIDLLALRSDGRLVVIELKTAPDRASVYQVIDYWRRIETARRNGSLHQAKIFGETEIRNEPALVFLVAPTLAFHHDFDFTASTVSPEIEIYRFELNEDWRREIKVLRRLKV